MSQPGATQPRATSPTVLVTCCDENDKQIPKITANDKCLAPNRNLNESFSESDRYYTASSGEEYDRFDNSDDSHDYDDDEGLCIRLDSEEDEHSLSGLHINLKTLQAVSSMLAHYNPIIQSDSFGNPLFIAPPPPEEDYENEDIENGVMNKTPQKTPVGSNRTSVTSAKKQSSTGEDVDDYEDVLQQLDDVIISQDKSLLSDAMTELTNVMEKMTRFSEENVDDK